MQETGAKRREVRPVPHMLHQHKRAVGTQNARNLSKQAHTLFMAPKFVRSKDGKRRVKRVRPEVWMVQRISWLGSAI